MSHPILFSNALVEEVSVDGLQVSRGGAAVVVVVVCCVCCIAHITLSLSPAHTHVLSVSLFFPLKLYIEQSFNC